MEEFRVLKTSIEKLREFKKAMEAKILDANNVIIVPHDNVDIDAISSALGISLIVRNLCKPSYIIVNDSRIEHGVEVIMEEAKNDFNFISLDEYYKMSDSNDLFILTDVNKLESICLDNDMFDEERIIVIDHHNEGPTTVKSSLKYINPSASSACEIVTRLLGLCKVRVINKIANDLLAGIYLDTNKFTKNVTSETARSMTKLIDMGASVNRVIDFFSEDFVSDRRVHALIDRMEILNDCIALVLADEGIEYTKEELAKVADYLLKYDGVSASFAVGKTDDSVVSISARSKEEIDVEKIMEQLDGGGNQYSAATKLSDCTVEEVGKKLKKVLEL